MDHVGVVTECGKITKRLRGKIEKKEKEEEVGWLVDWVGDCWDRTETAAEGVCRVKGKGPSKFTNFFFSTLP